MITMSDYADAAVGGQRAGTGLTTRTGWTSGMAFVRARCDGGAGVSMVIGLIGLDTWPPEIDFYEDWPSTNTRQLFTATVHYGADDTYISNTNTSVDATQWHIYGVDWNPTTITFFVDGAPWASIPNPSPTGANGFDQPMMLFMQIETKDAAVSRYEYHTARREHERRLGYRLHANISPIRSVPMTCRPPSPDEMLVVAGGRGRPIIPVAQHACLKYSPTGRPTGLAERTPLRRRTVRICEAPEHEVWSTVRPVAAMTCALHREHLTGADATGSAPDQRVAAHQGTSPADANRHQLSNV